MERAVIKTTEDFDSFTEDYLERERRGVINLPIPMLNINEWKSNPNLHAIILGLTDAEFERIAYYADAVVKTSDAEGYKEGDILSDIDSVSSEVLEKISIVEGAEAIEFLLSRVDARAKFDAAKAKEVEHVQNLEKLWAIYDDLGGSRASSELNEKITKIQMKEGEDAEIELSDEEASILNTEKSIDDLNKYLGETRCLLTALRHYEKHKADALVIRDIDLFPVDLRGAIKEVFKEMPYALDDIESQYRRVIYRTERLVRLINLEAPDVILRNEKRMLQEYIDCLINNGARGTYLAGRSDGYGATSLTDIVLRRTKLV